MYLADRLNHPIKPDKPESSHGTYGADGGSYGESSSNHGNIFWDRAGHCCSSGKKRLSRFWRRSEYPQWEPIPNVDFLQLDVRHDESAREAVRSLLSRAGRIDALVNNAGYTLIGSLEETSIEEAKQVFETNFFGVLRMNQAVLPIMRGQGYGRIVNISSVVGFLPAPYQGIYAASKHALEGYSESLDHEVRQFGIRVSVIEPGFTRTNIGQNSQVAGRPLDAYASERNRVLEAIRENTANGENPLTVASVVLEALTTRSPRPRYPVGREAQFLNRLRKLIPSKLFDKNLRKQFGLRAA